MIRTVLGILFFAIAIMIIYSWGIIKQQRQPVDLMRILNEKAEKKIVKELQKKGILTRQEIEKDIEGLKASQFGSRQKLIIKDGKIFSKGILQNLIDKNIIEIKILGNKKQYVLKNSNNI